MVVGWFCIPAMAFYEVLCGGCGGDQARQLAMDRLAVYAADIAVSFRKQLCADRGNGFAFSALCEKTGALQKGRCVGHVRLFKSQLRLHGAKTRHWNGKLIFQTPGIEVQTCPAAQLAGENLLHKLAAQAP